ncbi:MAG TPA: hypothetical protein VEI02_15925 [Planctomycetota bacterium]|nr:hypothetical protein [Planctomycetota bacterium]
MSRSRHFSELRRSHRRFGPDGERRVDYAYAAGAQELHERRRTRKPIAGIDGRTTAAGLHFVVEPESPEGLYPASVDELRLVLSRLPEGTLDGLKVVRLLDARRYVVEREAKEPLRTFSGTTGCIYAPEFVGRFRTRAHQPEVILYGFVVRRHGRVTRDEFAVLRRDFFDTLLHEVAHYVDSRSRRNGARVTITAPRRREDYAERMAAEWCATYVDESLVQDLTWPRKRYGIATARPATLARVLTRAAELAGKADKWDFDTFLWCLHRATQGASSQRRADQYWLAGERFFEEAPESPRTKAQDIAALRRAATKALAPPA